MACVRSERPSAFRRLTGKNGLHNGRQLRRADRVSSRVPGVGLQPGPELGRFSDCVTEGTVMRRRGPVRLTCNTAPFQASLKSRDRKESQVHELGRR